MKAEYVTPFFASTVSTFKAKDLMTTQVVTVNADDAVDRAPADRVETERVI